MGDDRHPATARYADVARLAFTGRDTAAGLSWDTWVRKQREKAANQPRSQTGS